MSQRPQRRSAPAGLLTGISLGVLAAYALAWVLVGEVSVPSGLGLTEGITRTVRAPLEDYRVLGALLLGAVLGGLAGGALGASKRPSQRRATTLRVVAYIAPLIAAVLLTALYATYHERAVRRAFAERKAALEQDAMDVWNKTYGAVYTGEAAALQAFLGPFNFPGSYIVDWPEVRPTYKDFRWGVILETEASLEDVLAYYMAVLPEGLHTEEHLVFLSEPQVSADWRKTQISFMAAGDHVRIRCATQFDADALEKAEAQGAVPNAWPEDLETRRARIAAAQHPQRERTTALLTPILPADARMIASDTAFSDLLGFHARAGFGQDPPSPNGVYITDAAWEDVLAKLSEQLGAPKFKTYAEGNATFSADMQENDGERLTLTVEALATPEMRRVLGGMALYCSTRPALGR